MNKEIQENLENMIEREKTREQNKNKPPTKIRGFSDDTTEKIDLSGESLTEQAYERITDINRIAGQWDGSLPPAEHYGDARDSLPMQERLQVMQEVHQAWQELTVEEQTLFGGDIMRFVEQNPIELPAEQATAESGQDIAESDAEQSHPQGGAKQPDTKN